MAKTRTPRPSLSAWQRAESFHIRLVAAVASYGDLLREALKCAEGPEEQRLSHVPAWVRFARAWAAGALGVSGRPLKLEDFRGPGDDLPPADEQALGVLGRAGTLWEDSRAADLAELSRAAPGAHIDEESIAHRSVVDLLGVVMDALFRTCVERLDITEVTWEAGHLARREAHGLIVDAAGVVAVLRREYELATGRPAPDAPAVASLPGLPVEHAVDDDIEHEPLPAEGDTANQGSHESVQLDPVWWRPLKDLATVTGKSEQTIVARCSKGEIRREPRPNTDEKNPRYWYSVRDCLRIFPGKPDQLMRMGLQNLSEDP